MRVRAAALCGIAFLTSITMARAKAAQDTTSPPAAAQAPAPPDAADASLDDAMREGEARRKAARAAALQAAAQGDPLDAYLALDRALELAPADAELLAAKKKLAEGAVSGALQRAGRLAGEGDIRAAVRLLAQMRLATDDARIAIAWKDARAERDALERAGRLPPEPAPDAGNDAAPNTARDRLGPTGVPPPVLDDGRAMQGELDRDAFREVEQRIRELESRLNRVSTPPKEDARAEPAVEFLDRKIDETKRDLERQINDLRREVLRLARDVDSARREVDRLRNRP